MSDLAVSSLAMSSLTLMVISVAAAFFCCIQVVRFARLAAEFKSYADINNLRSLSVVHAIFDRTELDKHQKILGVEAAFTAAAMVLSLGWLLVTIAMTW